MPLRKSANDLTQVILEAAYHHVIQVALDDLDTSAEALRIQQFEQSGEAVRMAVVRGGG